MTVGLTAQAQSYYVQERPRPDTWKQLVPGARFMDRFLPMQGDVLSADTWGADAVKPRLIDNGVEDRVWSYWGGNIQKGADGRYHLMVAAWLEASDRGHHEWPNSYVMHTISDRPYGPFKPYRVIGRGHNPEVYRTADGKWVLYVIGGRYVADDLMGKWTYGKYNFDNRDRRIIEGLSNLSFARRPDGSVLMVDRGGGMWVSPDGLSDFYLLTDQRAYPPVRGEFEDPVLWRDEVQYHMIVNDWQGRIAYYLRSIDGVHWKNEQGEAYMPGIARHADGTSEEWFKYERIKVMQDEHGRAVQANFAVIDTLKNEDKPYDRHSSKNICIPLNPGVLMSVEQMDKKGLTVRIQGEAGLNPQTDIDLSSLHCGSSDEVNFGRGATVLSSENSGADLLVCFSGNHGLDSKEFAAKLLGKRKDGRLLFGYARLPQAKADDAILSARRPVAEGKLLKVEVQNFGLHASKLQPIRILDGEQEVAKGKIQPLKPYEKVTLSLRTKTEVTNPNLVVEIAGEPQHFEHK